MSASFPDDDEALVGRRATDGNLISYREAVRMFATKEELAAMRNRVDDLPTRAEHELRWTMWEAFQTTTTASLKSIESAKIPTWLIALVPSIIAVATAFYFGAHK